jgi:hypothetical protein
VAASRPRLQTTRITGRLSTPRADAFSEYSFSAANGNYATIEYYFDSSASQETLATQDGWQPPVSLELLYQSG